MPSTSRSRVRLERYFFHIRLEEVPPLRYCFLMSNHTHSVRIFLEMVRAIRAGVAMQPRSANDKEYFAQDWFIDRLQAIGLQHQQQGRNSYPDFWAQDAVLQEGYE